MSYIDNVLEMSYSPSSGWHGHPSVCRSLDELWNKEYKRLKTNDEKRQWTDTKIAERKKINEVCFDSLLPEQPSQFQFR